MLDKVAGIGGLARGVSLTQAIGKLLEAAGKNPGKMMGGLAALGLGGAMMDDIGDVLKTKYISTSQPTWDAMGKAELLGENRSLENFNRAQEALLKLRYELPTDLISDEAKGLVGGIRGQIGKAIQGRKERQTFEDLTQTSVVKALGREKAKNIYDQISALSPGVITKAPGLALSAMETAIASGSSAIRPEVAKALSETASRLDNM